MAVSIATNREKVEWLLRRYPSLRDNDDELIACFWYRESKSKEIKVHEITASEFLISVMAKGGLTSSESIRRCRQKLQEEFPELRGKNYKGKQKHQETVKEELGYGN